MKRKLDPESGESNRCGRQDVTTRQNTESTERKRRRGMVEKRRRDRVNSLYMELMQLVPSVQRKMVTTKVEKAELLEMTVEYVRNSLLLFPKGTDSTEGTDTQLASRCYEAGHRDCSTKFSQYIIRGVEGLGANKDSFRQNLVAFIDKNVVDASQNGKDQRISTASPASLETKQNDIFSSSTTSREVLPTVCCQSTQTYLKDSIVPPLDPYPTLIQNYFQSKNEFLQFLNAENVRFDFAKISDTNVLTADRPRNKQGFGIKQQHHQPN